MARFVALLLAAACAGSTAGHAETAASTSPIADLPKRKPGLWRISTTSPEFGMRTHEVCIRESDGIIGAPDENCAKPLVERASHQIIATITRDRKDGREVTGILFTGDFQDWCRAQSKMSSTGAMLGLGGRIASRRKNGPEGPPLTSRIYRGKLERAKGFEPSTPTLARLCSTPELHPHPFPPVHRTGRGALYDANEFALQQPR